MTNTLKLQKQRTNMEKVRKLQKQRTKLIMILTTKELTDKKRRKLTNKFIRKGYELEDELEA